MKSEEILDKAFEEVRKDFTIPDILRFAACLVIVAAQYHLHGGTFSNFTVERFEGILEGIRDSQRKK